MTDAELVDEFSRLHQAPRRGRGQESLKHYLLHAYASLYSNGPRRDVESTRMKEVAMRYSGCKRFVSRWVQGTSRMLAANGAKREVATQCLVVESKLVMTAEDGLNRFDSVAAQK